MGRPQPLPLLLLLLLLLLAWRLGIPAMWQDAGKQRGGAACTLQPSSRIVHGQTAAGPAVELELHRGQETVL